MGPPRPARIVVTRPAGQESALVERLRALGHEVAHVPLVAIEPLGDDPIDVAGYDWVVLTSPNGAQRLLQAISAAGRDVRTLGGVRLAAIGQHATSSSRAAISGA